MASHERGLIFLLAASFAMPLNSESTLRGAATGPGRAKGALTSALSAGESFDMMTAILHNRGSNQERR